MFQTTFLWRPTTYQYRFRAADVLSNVFSTIRLLFLYHHRYANGVGFAEEHFDAYRALAGKRVDMPFSEATKDLLQRAGLEPT